MPPEIPEIKGTAHVIPAEPGWWTVWNGANDPFRGDQVIAWLIETLWDNSIQEYFATTIAITVNGTDEGNALLAPDGRVIVPGDSVYASLTIYRKYLQEK